MTSILYRPYSLGAYREERARQKYSLHFDHEVPRTMIEDLPVFDRGKPVNPREQQLPHQALDLPIGKRRPGTPVSPDILGDPHPDRLARAEALREQLKARDSRYRIPGSEDCSQDRDARHRFRRPGAKSQTPDIEKPRSYYVDIAAGSAFIEGRRGDDVLYFMTISEAARCMTGESRDVWRTAIKNAADGTVKGAFGWTWLRLRSRRGKNR